MILFELRCAHDHNFEVWFRDGAAYDAQVAAGEVVCPLCGDIRVVKAPMAPRLASGRGDVLDARQAAHDLRRKLGELRREVEKSCDYVGDSFAEEARRIHYGETPARAIYGEASAGEARELEDEGVAVRRIPWVAPDG